MPDMILLETEEHMEERLDNLKKEFSKIRTGRANPRVLDSVRVDYYGALSPISQVANISVPEATQLLIKPFDRSITKEIEKAILAANLGFTPQNEGTQIRIVLPPLTTERRKEYTKLAKKLGEEFKVFIRNSRRDANEALKKMEKDSDISEDDLKGYSEDVQELTNKYISDIDLLVKEKEEDIMSI